MDWQAGQEGESGASEAPGGLTALLDYLRHEDEVEKIQPTDLYIDGGFESDAEIGSSILKLVTDWSWIRRRVESVRVITDGQTRRQLSFDFVLPNEPGLRWRPTKGHRGAVVPLTFLRKGMLVNLDLADASGVSLPSLSMSENAQLTYQAMRLLTQELRLAETADELFPNIEDVFGERLLKHPCRACDAVTGRTTWEDIIDRAVLDIVMSAGYDTKAVDYTTMSRVQDVHRHDLFTLAAQLCALSAPRAGVDSAKHPDQLIMSPWTLGYKKSREEPSEDHLLVLDSSVPVQVLACVILHEIDRSRAGGDNSASLRTLELLCQLLAITSISYLFTVVMNEDQVWPDTTGETSPESRQLVKLSCDVEISDPKPEGWGSRILAGCRELMRNWVLFRSEVGTVVRYSNWSASSTHLEFSPPENTVVKKIVAERGDFLAEAAGTDDPSAPAAFPLVLPGGEPIPRGTRERHYWGDRKTGSMNHLMSLRERKVRHGSYRTSQGRVHVTQTKVPVQPIDSLRFYLAPRLSGQPLLAALTAVLITACSAMILLRQQENKEIGTGAWFDFSVFVALETLVLAVLGALLLTSGRHRVAREVWAGPRRLIIAAALIAVVTPATGLPGLWAQNTLTRSSGPGDLTWGTWLWGVLTLCGVLSLWLSMSALLMQWRCRDDDASLREEKVIEERIIPGYRHRPYQNVVAVTETGAGDCDYLTDDFIRYYGLAASVSRHRTILARTAAAVVDRRRSAEKGTSR